MQITFLSNYATVLLGLYFASSLKQIYLLRVLVRMKCIVNYLLCQVFKIIALNTDVAGMRAYDVCPAYK